MNSRCGFFPYILRKYDEYELDFLCLQDFHPPLTPFTDFILYSFVQFCGSESEDAAFLSFVAHRNFSIYTRVVTPFARVNLLTC
jgi:hypothetical protein